MQRLMPRLQVISCIMLTVILLTQPLDQSQAATYLTQESPPAETQLLPQQIAVLNRRTYDADHLTAMPGILVCDESDPDCSNGDTDEQAAHIHAGTVYDYFKSIHHRDSYDDAGGIFTSAVHYDTDFNHLFWEWYSHS